MPLISNTMANRSCSLIKSFQGSTLSRPHVNPLRQLTHPPSACRTPKSTEDAWRWSAHNGVWKFRRAMLKAIAGRVSCNNKSNRKADDPRNKMKRAQHEGPACMRIKKVELQKAGIEWHGTCKVWVTCRILSAERCSKRMSNVPATAVGLSPKGG